ncbi:MAG: NADH-quinone oxidoreductase subunit L [Acidocella sp.]|nr:NADH-quinone oxidoreductase subunit L [Acidocella sp.]
MISYLWLIPALPLLGSVILGMFGPSMGPRLSGAVGTLSVGLAAVLAMAIALQWLGHPPAHSMYQQTLWSWINLPGFSINVGLYLDPVSLLMVLVITIVGCLIHLFSTEYMEGEDGYSRFFAYLNLFVSAMLLLVLADDLALLFVGWEGVGVCSYLLVGFWFSESANGYAARKSFVVTRVADIFMLAGLLLLATQLGTLNIQNMLAGAVATWPSGSLMPAVAASLLLMGGLGKSAQVPLQTWLPDAMAGPTPVSALIHAATMVTAGVYLVVRTHALFLLAPSVLDAIAIGAVITLLVAAFAGLVQSDIKRVLAYSTMSQIGYMFLALGVGAWPAAMFHFMTHAVFKALLFLTAGAIAMRLDHEQNIFAMGGLRTKLPLAFWAFLIGSASLAALPVISAGFFSKEMILGAVAAAPMPGMVLWGAGILGAMLTAIYIFRVVFMVFLGPVNTEISGSYGLRVAIPLVTLSAGALVVGWLETPETLGGQTIFSQFLSPAVGVFRHLPVSAMIPLTGIAAPLLGVAIAYTLYRNGTWARAATTEPSRLTLFLKSGSGFDTLYDAVIVAPYMGLVQLLRRDPVDQMFMLLRDLAVALHRQLRATQIGQIRRYASWMMAGSVATIAILLFA